MSINRFIKGILTILYCMVYSLLVSNLLIYKINTQDVDTIISHDLYKPIIYAPWRSSYSSKVSQKENVSEPRTEKNCPFCLEMNAGNDAKYFILKRGKHCVAMLNPFPYAKGHMLIVPYLHKPHLDDFESDVRSEMMELAHLSFLLLQKKYGFPGANIGLNVGRCASASIPEHLHMQVVPRGYHEIGFLHTIGNTTLVTGDLVTMYQELKPEFDHYPCS